MCEISHQSNLNVGVVGDTAQDLGTLECSLWIGAAVVQIPASDKHSCPLNLQSFCDYQPLLFYNRE